jgi:predicted DNA-binding transcriptional regulator YafY
MRAGRLIHMILMLQRRGRITAAELSEEFGVSTRTVLRDVEALHEAGIPIYTSQGSGGGIELVAGFRTALTGLAAEEAGAVLLIGQPELARQLGLSGSSAVARHKLLAALTPDYRHRAEELDRWLLTDPYSWSHSAPKMLDRLASATRRSKIANLAFGTEQLEVRPLGLVAKAGHWYLLHDTSIGAAAIELTGLTSVRASASQFPRPADFDLPRCWAELVRNGVRPKTVGRPI